MSKLDGKVETMNKVELIDICRQLGIKYCKGKTRLPKEELIGMIREELDKEKEDTTEQTSGSVVAKEKEATPFVVHVKRGSKERYLQEIQVGSLVAFVDQSGRVNTAAVYNMSFKREKLKVATKYGKEFIISFDDVLWVKTVRWPLFILRILKEKCRVKCIQE